MSGARTGSRFSCIEVARGVAAILVVFYHCARMLAQPRFSGVMPFGGHTGNLNAGVDFFFTLSGFIITWTHWRDLGQRARIGNYARKRFLRIYPPYWGIVLPLLALYLLVPDMGKPEQHAPMNVLLSLLLAPDPQQPVLGVAWTLTYEIFFYILFVVPIAFGARALIIMPLWAAAIVIATLNPPTSFWLTFALSSYNLEFILGVAAAVLLRRFTVPAPRLLTAAGILLFGVLLFATPTIQATPLLARLGFGGASALFVLGTVEMERQRPVTLPRLAALFGAASYAIYLIHPVALLIAARVLARAKFFSLPPDLAEAILAVIAITVGVLYHRRTEGRLVRLAERFFPAAAPRDGTAPRPDLRTVHAVPGDAPFNLGSE